jgi:hypothetical protein
MRKIVPYVISGFVLATFSQLSLAQRADDNPQIVQPREQPTQSVPTGSGDKGGAKAGVAAASLGRNGSGNSGTGSSR